MMPTTGERPGKAGGPFWVFAALALLAPVLSGCSEKKGQSMPVPPVPVMVAAAEQKDVPVQIQAIGTVEAYTTVTMKAQVSAQLKQVHFKEGQEVRQGDLLFTLDSSPFEADLRRAEANLARNNALKKQVEANLTRDLAQAKNASMEESRYRQLFEKGVAAREQYDQAHTALAALDAAVSADRAAIENASEAIRADSAAIDQSKIQLSYCTIRSPINGRTGSILVQPGNLVKANDNPALVIIYQIQPIRVTFSVPEQNLSDVRRRMASGKVPVNAIIPGDEAKPAAGTLTFVDNAVNSSTGTILLKATYSNADKRLWPGQFVNVVLTLSILPNAIVVPSEAIQAGQQGNYVFVIKSGTAESRQVVTGQTAGGFTVIDKGIQSGETVVTDGQLRLVPGAKVQIMKGLLQQRERS